MTHNLDIIIKKAIALVMICITVQIVVNSTLYVHFHVTPEGKVVSHAHPHADDYDSKSSGETHQHSAFEFVCIDNLSQLFSGNFFEIFHINSYTLRNHFIHQQEFTNPLTSSLFSTRAPPKASLLIRVCP